MLAIHPLRQQEVPHACEKSVLGLLGQDATASRGGPDEPSVVHPNPQASCIPGQALGSNKLLDMRDKLHTEGLPPERHAWGQFGCFVVDDDVL